MIVLIHAWAAFQYVKCSGVEFITWTAICTHMLWMAVPTLFMISGYLLFVGYDMSRYPRKMIRRIKRLAVPYIIWNMLFGVCYVLLARVIPSMSSRVASLGVDSFSGALANIFSLSDLPIDGPLWYLRLVFLFALVSPVLWLVMRIGNGLVALALCAAWCVAESLLGLTAQLQLNAPAYAISCFVLGGVLAMHRKALVDMFKCPWWIVFGFCACTIRGGGNFDSALDIQNFLTYY